VPVDSPHSVLTTPHPRQHFLLEENLRRQMQSRPSCRRFRAPDLLPGPGRFPAPDLRPGSFLASALQHHRFSDRPRARRRSSVLSPLAPRNWFPARSTRLSDSFPAYCDLLWICDSL